MFHQPAVIYGPNASAMQWMLASSPSAQIREYRLCIGGQTKLVLRYHPALRSIRIKCDTAHRLFYMESTGSLSGKYLFKNEYGQVTGSMQWDKSLNRQAQLQMGGQDFRCRLIHDRDDEMEIIDPAQRLAGHCVLQSDAPGMSLRFADHAFLLPGLCWYLSLSGRHDRITEVAA
jgi:hypothetical protein